jgi:hypothetical protein
MAARGLNTKRFNLKQKSMIFFMVVKKHKYSRLVMKLFLFSLLRIAGLFKVWMKP